MQKGYGTICFTVTHIAEEKKFSNYRNNQPHTPVADPEFHRRGWGANFRGEGLNPLFDKIFAKKYMKMKEIGPRGGVITSTPLDSPMYFIVFGGKIVIILSILTE